MKIYNALASPARNPPVTSITRVVPRFQSDFKKCEVHLNIGLFFDGTRNNREADTASYSHSNIARLYNLYSSDEETGIHHVYIPGVGTSFPEIGERDESKLGSGCAIGCEGRVIFGLLAVFNALYRRSYQVKFFDPASVLALCRNGPNVTNFEDSKHLAKLGASGGLLEENMGSSSSRRDFLTRQISFLEAKLKTGKPRVVECFVDVFGFSRGAAEARVFCSWLDELLVGGRLAGVPIRFRMLGIIDTVASAGFWSGTTALTLNSTGGHGAWANNKSLRVPTSVQNCVHMVAMHELRRNFPLDGIEIEGKLQPGWVQIAYPGSHSDVGGGYRPGELGMATRDDSMKLSQIPLSHMLDCAIAAGVPMRRPKIQPGSYDELAIHPNLAKAFDEFISQARLEPRPMYEWLQPYLNWRWQVRHQFHTTTQVRHANEADKKILINFNRSLIADAAAMERTAGGGGFIERSITAAKAVLQSQAKHDMMTVLSLEPEARSVFEIARKSKTTPQAFSILFENYVHDSLAGFNSQFLERPGYWRYRKAFVGSDDYSIAANDVGDSASNIA